MKILCIQTGGTIDKGYPRATQGWGFEIGEAAIKEILENYKHSLEISYESFCKKDSMDISDEDRQQLVHNIESRNMERVIITHGTDTVIETGLFLSNRVREKVVVLTGSSLPAKFKDSDAPVNIGLALAAVQTFRPGIYLAIHGIVLPIAEAERNLDSGLFTRKK